MQLAFSNTINILFFKESKLKKNPQPKVNSACLRELSYSILFNALSFSEY